MAAEILPQDAGGRRREAGRQELFAADYADKRGFKYCLYVPYELSFTKKFEVAPERSGWGPHFFYINECCWGCDVVCERLLPLIEPHYEKVRSLQEDWGWFIWFRKGDQKFEINVMCDCPEFGDFRIHLVAFRRDWLFRRVTRDTPELEQVREVVTNELRAWAGEVKTTAMDVNFMPQGTQA